MLLGEGIASREALSRAVILARGRRARAAQRHASPRVHAVDTPPPLAYMERRGGARRSPLHCAAKDSYYQERPVLLSQVMAPEEGG